MERLKKEHDLALANTDDEIKKWETFRSDYDRLRSRLMSLPENLTQEIMVPLGTKAFMRGKLVHTNEILVLLGDNWFAEQSAKQAADIVSRRLQAVEENISKLNEQRRLLGDRQDFTEQLFGHTKGGDCVEINEEYDEEKEQLWKETHKENVKKYRSGQNKKVRIGEGGGKVRDWWERLDELEALEREGDEMNRIIEGEEEAQAYKWSTKDETALGETGGNKSVRWGDGEGEGESEEEWTDGTCITFSHTQVTAGSDNDGCTTVPEPGMIASPADLYKHFYRPPSILKHTAMTGGDEAMTQVFDDIEPTRDMGDVSRAFSGEIIEHMVGHKQNVVPATTTSHVPVTTTNVVPTTTTNVVPTTITNVVPTIITSVVPTVQAKKVSKFRQERQTKLAKS